MDELTAKSPIDTGIAPEIYADDLGDIQIMEHNVCWVSVRQHQGERVVVVKVITPMSAVPSIAAQMMAAFATHLTRRAKDGLATIASFVH